MTYNVTHRYGAMEKAPPLDTLGDLLAELDERPEDKEHGSVALTHESEWCLSAYRGGTLVLEHLEGGGERHLKDVPRDKILRLWTLLARGDIASVEREPWQPGYP